MPHSTPLSGTNPGRAVSHHDQHLHQLSPRCASLPRRDPHRPASSFPRWILGARNTLTEVSAVDALRDIVFGHMLMTRPGVIAMRQVLLRETMLLASWAIGLLVAAWIVPGVSLSVPGFIVSVGVFAITQGILSLPILKLRHEYASLLFGGTGLASTIVGLAMGSLLTRGLTIDGIASWLATTIVVWLVTTIGAITLPEILSAPGPTRRDDHMHAPGHIGESRRPLLKFRYSVRRRRER
jgi:hypothetical protein